MPQRSSTSTPTRQERPPVNVERGLVKRQETESHPLVLAIEQRMPAITRMLPASMDGDRFQSIVLSAVVQNPEILTCDPASVIDAVIQAAREGLEPTGASGGAYLVPFYDKGTRKAQLIRDYRGIAKLLIHGGTVTRIDTGVVRAGDHFEYELGMHPQLIHRPKVGNDADAHSYYALGWLPDGTVKIEVMTRAQVEHIRGKSKSWSKDKPAGPWHTDFDQMGRKTVMKRMANNQLPISHEVRSQLVAEDEAEFGEAGVVISRVPDSELAEKRQAIHDRTARLTGGNEQPAQETPAETSDGAPATKAAASAPQAGHAPTPAQSKPEPEPSLDDAQKAVYAAAKKAGLLDDLPKAPPASDEYKAALDANWTKLDELAQQAIPDQKPESLDARGWLFVKERIEAGDYTDQVQQ